MKTLEVNGNELHMIKSALEYKISMLEEIRDRLKTDGMRHAQKFEDEIIEEYQKLLNRL